MSLVFSDLLLFGGQPANVEIGNPEQCIPNPHKVKNLQGKVMMAE